MIVRNKPGASGVKCTCCGSWLEHYLRQTGSSKKTCAVVGCSNTATVGARVHAPKNASAVEIVRMCEACSRRGGDLDIGNTALVSSRPCG